LCKLGEKILKLVIKIIEMKINNRRGFTLFELLVSISIIGILTALVSVSFSAAQKKARDARRLEDMNAIKIAAEQYYSLSGTYSYPVNTSAPASWTANGQIVLELFPTDPKGVGWTAYSYPGTVTGGYCACAAVENTAAGNSTTNNCVWASSGAYFCVKNQQ